MKSKLLVIIGILVFVVGFIGGCNAIENLSNSSSRLILELLTGPDLEGTPGSTTVFSDVITSTGSIFNDNASVTLRAELLNPDETVTSTYYQDIIIDQIDVSYSRTDGLNIEGSDVPYSFSQKVNYLVTIGNIITMDFVVVQHNAKTESPLVELVNLGQEHILKMEAKCTFYGKDVGGNRVAPVTGSISIWFANFADTD